MHKRINFSRKISDYETRWRSIDREPPQHNQQCIFADDAGIMWLGIWQVEDEEASFVSCTTQDTLSQIDGVVWWKPLIPPPKSLLVKKNS